MSTPLSRKASTQHVSDQKPTLLWQFNVDPDEVVIGAIEKAARCAQVSGPRTCPDRRSPPVAVCSSWATFGPRWAWSGAQRAVRYHVHAPLA